MKICRVLKILLDECQKNVPWSHPTRGKLQGTLIAGRTMGVQWVFMYSFYEWSLKGSVNIWLSQTHFLIFTVAFERHIFSNGGRKTLSLSKICSKSSQISRRVEECNSLQRYNAWFLISIQFFEILSMKKCPCTSLLQDFLHKRVQTLCKGLS